MDKNFENVENENDESSNPTISNVRRRSHSLSGDNSDIISEPEFFLGKDILT